MNDTIFAVFENPCRIGEPYMIANRPQICSPQSSCPEKYFCHIGAEDNFHCCLIQGMTSHRFS